MNFVLKSPNIHWVSMVMDTAKSVRKHGVGGKHVTLLLAYSCEEQRMMVHRLAHKMWLPLGTPQTLVAVCPSPMKLLASFFP